MLSAPSTSLVSHMCILPASPEKVSQAPPLFSSTKPGHHDDGCRPRLLTPQCHFLDMSPRHPSPLRPADCPPPRGLHRQQSDILIKVPSERRAALGSRKLPDLRKELAIKNQRNKHLERRALFLSKMQELASCTGVCTPKAAPAPMPPLLALEPPLASFESLTAAGDRHTRNVGFEQMDSLLPIGNPKVDLKSGRHNLPSLEDIIARVGPARSMTHDPITTVPTPRPFMLPRGGRDASATRSVPDTRLDINVGRLHMPVRRRQSSTPIPNAPLSAMHNFPIIEITAPPTPDTGSSGRYVHPNHNVRALGRANTARDMITTIKRRTSPPPSPALNQCRSKRHSAPADMQLRGRSGFEHPNLSLPGGF